jgi:hypothetical protein
MMLLPQRPLLDIPINDRIRTQDGKNHCPLPNLSRIPMGPTTADGREDGTGEAMSLR